MNRFPPKLLLVIVLGIETVVSGWAIVGQLRRPAPPEPPVSRVAAGPAAALVVRQ